MFYSNSSKTLDISGSHLYNNFTRNINAYITINFVTKDFGK